MMVDVNQNQADVEKCFSCGWNHLGVMIQGDTFMCPLTKEKVNLSERR